MSNTMNERISELRKKKKLTQEQLGAMLGISGQAVSKWEKGESLPDILLLPQLCEILNVSVDTLLDTPEAVRQENIMQEFQRYASKNGKSAMMVEAISRMWHDDGRRAEYSYLDFRNESLCMYDESGMGFVVDGTKFFEQCLVYDKEEISFLMRILSHENCLDVLSNISFTEAVTKEELGQKTGFDEPLIDRILTGFFKRGLIVWEKDNNGKWGYLQAEAMAGIYMILAGCRMLNKATAPGMIRFSRCTDKW